MARYRMEDGTFVDPEVAIASWHETEYLNGKKLVSRVTNSEWEHETLYRTTEGRFYIITSSRREGVQSTARYIQKVDAAMWLLTNRYQPTGMPSELAELIKRA